jgi:hypothetical protein
VSAESTSAMDASKLGDESCRTRAPGRTPNVPRIASTRFTALRCSTSTPLGRPVDPDV